MRHHAPATLSEARFSTEFALAAALVHGRLGLGEVSQASLQDPVVRDLMARVTIDTVQTQCPLEPSFAFTDEVTITLRSGTVLRSGPIRFARGHAQLPIGDEALLDKLLSCAGSRAAADAVLQQVDRALA